MGLIWGLSVREAFRFSFLLSLPAIAGAALLELGDLTSLSLPHGWAWGVVAAFLSGLAALRIFYRVVTLGRWRFFAAYCAALGTVALFL